VFNRRTLLKTLGLGALAAAPGAAAAQEATATASATDSSAQLAMGTSSDRTLNRMHPIAVARRIATMQLAFQQKTGSYDRLDRVFGDDPRRVPDDHPLKPSFLTGGGFDLFGLDVTFQLRPDKSGYWMTIGPKDGTSRYFVSEKNVIYRSTDDTGWGLTDLKGLSPDRRLWTPIVRKEFSTKTASSTLFGFVASALNAVVPVVQARADHSDCCNPDYPWWWWDCYNTRGISDCVGSTYCSCAGGFYFCVQGFADCQGCCINCDGNCECAWDRCPGS